MAPLLSTLFFLIIFPFVNFWPIFPVQPALFAILFGTYKVRACKIFLTPDFLAADITKIFNGHW